MSKIEVVAIPLQKKEIKKFVKFAWKIYKGNKYWVPPIISDLVGKIVSGPYHEVGVLQPFLAYKDGEIVGRIIAHYDKRHNEVHEEKSGRFGFFECINDKEVSRALFDSSKEWLIKEGMKTYEGPFSFLQYDASGLLLDDYENIPSLELAYNPPYYVDLVEDYGFKKGSDWFAFLATKEMDLSPLVFEFHKNIQKRIDDPNDGLTIRSLNLKDFENEKRRIQEVFNKAWEKNLLHYPLTDTQIDAFGEDLKLIAKEELIIFAEYNGELIGFILSLPDANPAIQKANGRLFPFGLLKILWKLKKIRRLKTFMMGVLPEYRKQGIDMFFYLETYLRGTGMGYNESCMSLIVENNIGMLKALEIFGGEKYKTYRFYKKDLHS